MENYAIVKRYKNTYKTKKQAKQKHDPISMKGEDFELPIVESCMLSYIKDMPLI